jgi:hypothetical protein
MPGINESLGGIKMGLAWVAQSIENVKVFRQR